METREGMLNVLGRLKTIKPADKTNTTFIEMSAEEAKESDIKAEVERIKRITPTIYKGSSMDEFSRGPIPPTLKEGKSVLFLGSNGIGKTKLAWAYALSQAEAGKKVEVIKAFKLLSKVKSVIGQMDVCTFMEEEYGKRLDVLIIDEVDKIFGSAADYVYLTHIIDNRYEWAKQTVVMGNCNKDQFEAQLGSACYSRLSGDGNRAFYIEGEDKRQWKK